ncbi:MAG: hypothetical protein WDN76_11665 [Alphaproteobacteria bacterium]
MLAAEATTEKSHGTLLAAARNIVEEQVRAIGDNPNSIILLRDSDNDGVADQKSVFLTGLHQPSGMGLLVNSFYVATTDAVAALSLS